MAFFNNVFTLDVGSAGSPARGIFDFLYGSATAGTKATPRTALTLSAFYNGVDQISNDLAKLPKGVFIKDGESRVSLPENTINYLISVSPNDLMSAFDFWKVIQILVIIKGNAYVKINRDAAGEVASLDLMDNDEIEVIENEGKLFYRSGKEVYNGNEVLHFKGFSLDGVMGVGVITFAAANLGVNLDAQEYQSSIYKDRGIGYGVIESEQTVTNDNKKAIEDGFSAKMSKGDKFRVPLLDSGLKYKSIVVTPEEAQFIESNKIGSLDIARWLNIAPHKIKILDNANFSNIYHQSIEHTQDSILPWITRFEQEMKRKFFGKLLPNYYVKMNEKVLLRGDLAAKQQYYATMRYAGLMTGNEIRALEDLNPIEGLSEPLQPVNMEMLSYVLEKNKKELNDEKE